LMAGYRCNISELDSSQKSDKILVIFNKLKNT
jgi:hypothetical protein